MLTSYRTWNELVLFCKPHHESVPCETGSKHCNHKGVRERWHACPAATEHICGVADGREGVDLILQAPTFLGVETYYIRPELGVQMHRVGGPYGGGINAGNQRRVASPQMVLNESGRLDVTRGLRCMLTHRPTTGMSCGRGEMAAATKLGWAHRASVTNWLHHSTCIDLLDLKPTAADEKQRRIRWQATLREASEMRGRFSLPLGGGGASLGKATGRAAAAGLRGSGVGGGGGGAGRDGGGVIGKWRGWQKRHG